MRVLQLAVVELFSDGIDRGGVRRRFSGETEQIIQDVQTYSEVGATHIIFDIRSSDLNQTLERMAWFAEEVIAGHG